MNRFRFDLPWAFVSTALIATLGAGARHAGAQSSADSVDVQRGRYLAQIAGCNDCHTPGYAKQGGKVDEKSWLTGGTVGFRGPWGTTYPANLRLVAHDMSEDAFVARARSSELRPPMPWFAVRDMTDADARSIYRYLKHLGPAGESAPAYVPPGAEPKTAAIGFPEPPK